MGCNQLYSLSWGEFSSSLSSTVQVLRDHGELVDVTLAAGGKIFPAHKLVLSAASPLLMELLKSTQCQHPVVMLAGIAASDLEALLQFVYQGEVSVDPSQLPSLLQAAQCLDIQALSPATISSDKAIIGAQPGESRIALPMMRKRKKKAKLSCHEESSSLQALDSKDNIDIKDGNSKKPPLISDLPVSCGICGAMLRQSRNLRRHMELIHMKPEDPPRKRKTKKCSDLSGEVGQSVGVGEQGISPPIQQPQSTNSQPEMPGHDRNQQNPEQQQQVAVAAAAAAVMAHQSLAQDQMSVYHGGGSSGPPQGFMYQEPAYPPYPHPHPRPPDLN